MPAENNGTMWRMLQLRGQLDLTAETLDVHRCREVGRQDLHHDFARQRGLLSDEDARHSAAAELALECVRTA